MKPTRLRDYLGHILQATQEACDFVAGMSRDDFQADLRTQKAVEMNLVVIGEAASRLMEQYAEFTQRHPELPWREMRGMRNRMAHGYF